MNITRSLLENLCALAAGKTIAASKLKGKWVNEMLQDGALVAISHGSRVTYKVAAVDYFQKYLAEKYNLRDVKAILDMKLSHDTERSRQVAFGRFEAVEATNDEGVFGKRIRTIGGKAVWSASNTSFSTWHVAFYP